VVVGWLTFFFFFFKSNLCHAGVGKTWRALDFYFYFIFFLFRIIYLLCGKEIEKELRLYMYMIFFFFFWYMNYLKSSFLLKNYKNIKDKGDGVILITVR
jgi:hypothetical protein